jgi:glutaryl-CoA dehydrogenase
MTDEPTDTWSGSSPVPPNRGDFYNLLALLPDDQQALLADVRDYLETDIAPVITEHWERAEFPAQIVPALAKMNLAGSKFTGYGCPGQGELFHGLLNVELARIDPSLAVFFGGHDGLGMGTIALCGSEEQKQRWLPPMARMEKIGAFALTEPDVGSDAARGLATTARRDGDTWVLNGVKKWIGNATWCDLVVVWARDEADGQVKGFVVERGTPGFTTEKMHGKTALRIMQNALITLDDCRVAEADRLQHANSFADTARVLRTTRLMVAWQAAGTGRGAFEHALAYATRRTQFGRPIARFQLVQDLLARMLANTTASLTMCARLAELAQAGDMQEEQVSLAKMYVTTATRETVGWAREVFGGNGVLLDHHVTRYTNDAEAIYSFEGTREINSLIVGRALTGISAFV